MRALTKFHKLGIFQYISASYPHLEFLKSYYDVDIYVGNDYGLDSIICTFENYDVGKFNYIHLNTEVKVEAFSRFRKDAYGVDREYIIIRKKMEYPKKEISFKDGSNSFEKNFLNANIVQYILKNSKIERSYIISSVYGRVLLPVLEALENIEGTIATRGLKGNSVTMRSGIDTFLTFWREPIQNLPPDNILLIEYKKSLYKIPVLEFKAYSSSLSEDGDTQWTKKYKISLTALKEYELPPF